MKSLTKHLQTRLERVEDEIGYEMTDEGEQGLQSAGMPPRPALTALRRQHHEIQACLGWLAQKPEEVEHWDDAYIDPALAPKVSRATEPPFVVTPRGEE